MRYHSFVLAGAALLALGAHPALASCADEIAALSAPSGTTVAAGTAATGTVSKDGSQAPLEQVEPAAGAGAAAAGAAAAGSEGITAGETTGPAARAAGVATDTGAGGKIAKDGSGMPLENDGAAPAVDTAMSQQDVDAQQAGGTTAAGQASTTGGQAPMSGEAMVALNRARAADRAGDEAGCMKAIDEAKSLQAG